MKRFCLACATLLLLSACDSKQQVAAPEEKEKPAAGVVISDEDAVHIGLKTAPLAAADYIPHVTGYGVVTSLETIAQTQADIAAAAAAATESRATLTRAQNLSRTASAAIARKDVDAAVHSAEADAAALGLAQRKAIAAFGKDAPWLKGRSGILADLNSGRLALVHVSFTSGALIGAPAYFDMTPLNRGTQAAAVRSKEIWSAPADASIPGQSYYALIDGNAFAPGERVNVAAPAGTAQKGLVVPSDAVLLSDNTAWFYTKAPDGSYVRHPLDLTSPLPGGYFAKAGAAPGDFVVTSGAGLVLARELNPSTEPEE